MAREAILTNCELSTSQMLDFVNLQKIEIER